MQHIHLLEYAKQMDTQDPLAGFRNEFVIDDPDLIYLDGNSLGRLPKRTPELVHKLVEQQWGSRLVRSWGEGWIDIPQQLSTRIARLIGADEDEVLVCDSTSVNFYKLAMAALTARPGRRQIVSDTSNFPSDLYVLQGCAKQCDRELLLVETGEVEGSLSKNSALLSLSHVAFKSGYIHPMSELTQLAQDAGALTLWDLSHSVGAVPIDLRACNVDLAVGCTYKYLNGGPGSPAFLYVRRDLHEELLNPVCGWFGQKDAFGFGLDYVPATGIQKFMVGTPSILSIAAIECGVDIVLEAGMEAIRAKSILQTEFLIELWRTVLEPLGMELNSPVEAKIRGSHVSLGHPQAFQIDQALIQEKNVIPDFRTPDNIRLGVNPLYTTFAELHEAVVRMENVIVGGSYKKYPAYLRGVT